MASQAPTTPLTLLSTLVTQVSQSIGVTGYDVITVTASSSAAAGMTALFVTNIMKWLYLLVGVLGITCNAFVIYVISRSRQLQQQPRNWLILHQSLADLVGAFFLITITTRSTSTELVGIEGWLICTIWYSNALLWICYVSSEYILVTLTFEVFMAIVYPVRHKNVITTRRLVVTVGIIWLGATVYHVAYNMATCQVVDGVCYNSRIMVTPTALPAFVTVNFFLKLFFPASMFAGCYVGMALSLRKSKIGLMQSSDVPTATSQMQLRATKNIYYTLSYTLLLHLVTWSGNQFTFLLFGFGYAINSTSFAFSLPLLAIYMSSFINPIIYIFKYERFRKAIVSAFPAFRKFDSETTPPTSKINNLPTVMATHKTPLDTY